MSPTEFCLAVLVLLFTPGPTNTLMALAGTAGQENRLSKFVLAEVAGYMSMVTPLWWLSSITLDQYPEFGTVLRIVASVWLLFLSVRLWGGRTATVTPLKLKPSDIFWTTVTNPKGIVFGTVLLPLAAFDASIAAFLLVALIFAAGTSWFLMGRFANKSFAGGPTAARVELILRRVAAVWLVVIAGAFAYGSLSPAAHTQQKTETTGLEGT